MKRRIALKICNARYERPCRYGHATIWRAQKRLNHTPEAFKHRRRQLDAISKDIAECRKGFDDLLALLGVPKEEITQMLIKSRVE